MTKPQFVASHLRTYIALVLGSAMTLATLGANPAAAAPTGSVQGNSVSIPAGGSAAISVRGIALQPGSLLPTGALTVANPPFPADRVRTTLYYGIDWGYTDSDPQQVALAVWWMQDGTWRDPNHDIAARIANAAASSPGTPSWNPEGRSLLPLVGQGQITLSDLSLTASQYPSIGDGSLAVQNTSDQDLIVYLPYGTIFSDGTASVLVWAVATAGPTATPTSQDEQPTATSVPEATDTPASAPTDTPSYKDGYTPEPQDTPTPIENKPPPATTTSAGTATPQPADTATPTNTAEPVGPPSVATQAQDNTSGSEDDRKAPPASDQAGAAQSPQDGQVQGQSRQGSAPANSQQTASAPMPLPTSTATRGGSGNNAPSPVSTAKTGQVAVPSPINTSLPANGLVGPPPQPTGPAPLPTTGKPSPTAFNSSAVTPTKPVTITSTPTPGSSSRGSQNPLPTQKPVIKTPAPAPTPAPQPGGPPVINTQGDSSGKPGNNTSGATGSGPRPTNNPVTGAGPSSLPLWLSLASVLMVLAGWMLRLIGRKPTAHRAQARHTAE